MYQQTILIGNLGNDPEMRYTPSHDPVTSFSLAVSKSWTKDGQRQEKTTWFRVSVWGNQAEPCANYLAKGRQVMVVGEVEEARVFTDRDGNPRASLEVRAREVKFLGQKPDGANSQAASAKPTGKAAPTQNNLDEDIPF